MKHLLAFSITLIFVSSSISTGCGKTEPSTTFEHEVIKENTNNLTDSKMKITIGNAVFKATLNSNATASDFKARLPITIPMKDLNGNEKYYDFQSALPASPSNPASIQAGDLMLYGSKTLVLFYKTFPTSYSYTSIGRVDDPEGLAAALGSKDLVITFELE